ncbi:hypothetical protein [Catenuloplanes atrovinosus]|uniref:Uncharacterized protein n=1 Tax=Catenuloplanes atrovinosus TaxID=137266 RepID=A0AAE3YRA9_9ACTN|nr:hypothetical protein [Catenuloplanes atrovinosus]MDR7277008.1 hypothetical protein [Catenuloplanes atrovinosus]
MHGETVVPSVLALSHAEQRGRLARWTPAAAGRGLVVGDPCYDRLLISRRLRDAYRRAYGVDDGRRLVFVSSTWWSRSSFGSDPGLIARLAAALPVDEYQLVAALHPSTWAAHGAWQVRAWLAEPLRSGLVLLDPRQGWHTALLAADLVIGDHGAVTCYAAGCGIPVVLAASADEEVIAESVIGQLLRTAPRLRPEGDLRAQLDDTIARFDPESYAGVRDLISSEPGRAAALIRAAGYAAMSLPEPPAPVRPLPFPPPDRITRQDPAAAIVTVRTEPGGVRVSRHPAAVALERRPPGLTTGHLVAADDPDGLPWLEAADVIVGRAPQPEDGWAGRTLRSFPGCALAAVPLDDRRCLVTGRDGARRLFTAGAALPDAAVLASVAYTHDAPAGSIPLITPAGVVTVAWRPVDQV